MWVIQFNNGMYCYNKGRYFVRKRDTIAEAKKFKTKEQAEAYAKNLLDYKVIEIKEGGL